MLYAEMPQMKHVVLRETANEACGTYRQQMRETANAWKLSANFN